MIEKSTYDILIKITYLWKVEQSWKKKIWPGYEEAAGTKTRGAGAFTEASPVWTLPGGEAHSCVF